MLEVASPSVGTFSLSHAGPFVAGMCTQVIFRCTVGADGLKQGARLRVGVPNTGWEAPVLPQQRYWDELVSGADRRLAPFHPVNTTAVVKSSSAATVALEVMERMLVPDEDPAFAYWRWWITATLEAGDLKQGDEITILYGDPRFGSDGIRVQMFPEPSINVTAYVQTSPEALFAELVGSPAYLDVVSGPPSRVNVVAPSAHDEDEVLIKVSLTDACQALPMGDAGVHLAIGAERFACKPGEHAALRFAVDKLAHAIVVEQQSGAVWGKSNPSVPVAEDKLKLFWGDLHAQSEHHAMHSQKKDFQQAAWSKGISCGTLDDCYSYGREVACLDFVAMTDQGACLTDGWEYCQEKVRQYYDPGKFVTFKAYEAGAANGHRNVIYVSDEVERPMSPALFNGFRPEVLFPYYRERGDAILIPHHVKTWTDWSFHDPQLEPVMEVYSCWGQSESRTLDLWNKGMTPGAGAWEAYRRGYRMGMIASSDNHVGMPGRSFPGDRQAHTPFKGGLCAIWCEELTRESLFSALRRKHCYGTTGARIVLRFTAEDQAMGSTMRAFGDFVKLRVEVHGTEELRSVEIVSSQGVAHSMTLVRGDGHLDSTVKLAVLPGGFYYIRLSQVDNERAWSSPIFFEV